MAEQVGIYSMVPISACNMNIRRKSKAACNCIQFLEEPWGSRAYLLLTGLIYNGGEGFAGADGLEFPAASLSLFSGAAAHLRISHGV